MAQVSSRVTVTAKKHIYDGVISSHSQNKLNSTAFPCFNDDDFDEIFGCSNKFDDHGVCTSIPIMELHVSDDVSSCGLGVVRGRGLDDYCGVFGGDDLDEELGLFDGVEMFDQLKKIADTCCDHLPRINGCTNQANGSFDSCQSQNGQIPTNGFCSFSDDLNHLQQKNNTNPANKTLESSHVFLIPATPESTSSFYDVGPSLETQTTRMPTIKFNTELEMETYPSEKAIFSRHRSIDLDVMKQKSEKDNDILTASLDKEPSVADTSHAVLQPTDDSSMATNVVGDDSISVPAYLLHEVGPSLEKQTMIEAGIVFPMANDFEKKVNHSGITSSECIVEEETNEYDSRFQRKSCLSESNSATLSHATLRPTSENHGATHASPGSTYSFHEVSPQMIQANETPVVEADTEHIVEIDLAKRGNDSLCTSSDPDADEDKNEQDAGFQKTSGLNEPNTSIISHYIRQSDTSAGPSKIVGKESVSSTSNPVTTLHNTCLVSSAVMNNTEAESAFYLGKKQHSHSRMTSLDLGDHRQAHKREATFQQSSHLRGSYSFDASHDRYTTHFRVNSLTSSENSPYRGNGGSPPALDDQLDINSAAAVSAATLQRALEQAETKILLAKKMRFKDTLQTKIMIEEDPQDVFRQEMMHVNWGRINHLKQASLHLEKGGELETARVEPVVEDHKVFLKKDESIIGENVASSKFIEESDKHGGEWEATKQLNQLISGVKNRIASFMSWQSEKKEDSKEIQARRQWPHQCDEKEPEEVKETEKNQSAATCADKTTLDEDVDTNQETVDQKVDAAHKTVRPTNTNFLCFSFNHEKSWKHLHTEEQEMEADQKSWKFGTENEEELMNEAKNEWTTDMGYEENGDHENDHEEAIDEEDLYCMDAREKSESSNEEDDPKISNEHHIDDRSVSTHEDDDNKILDEDHKDDKSVSYHEDDNKILNKDHIDDKSVSSHEEDGIKILNEDHRDDKSVSSHEEDDGKILNGDHRDDKNLSSHEEDDVKILNEDHRDEKSVSSHEEGGNKILDEDHNDDRSVSSHEENDIKILNEDCTDDKSVSCHEEDECGGESGVDEEYQNDSSMKEECLDSYGVNVECGGEQIKLIGEKENRREVNEECGDEGIQLPCEEEEDKRINDNSGDCTSQFNPEVDTDGMLSDEHKDGKRILSDKEDGERTVDVECKDDKSRLTDKEDDERTVDVEHEDDISRFSEEEDDERTVGVEREDDLSRLSDEEDDKRTVDMGPGDDGTKFTEEEIRSMSESHEEESVNSIEISENEDEWYDCEVVETAEEKPDHTYLKERNLVEETRKKTEMTAEGYGCQECKGIPGSNDYVDNESRRMNGVEEEDKRHEGQSDNSEETEKKEAVVLSKAGEATSPNEGCDPGVKEPVFSDEDSDIVLEISDYSSEPEMDIETSELLDEEGENKTQMADAFSDHESDIENPTFSQMETDGMEEAREAKSSTKNIEQSSGVDFVDCKSGTDEAFPCGNFDLHDCKMDQNCVSQDIGFKEMEPISEDILENHINHVNQSEYEKTHNVEEVTTVGDEEGEKESAQALHRRRRWFDFGVQPNIHQGNIEDSENELEVLEGSHSVGGVPIQASKLDSLTKEETSSSGADTTSNQNDIQVNSEANHKRRRWFVKSGDQGVPEPPNLFAGLKVPEAAEISEEIGKQNIDVAPRRKRWFESEAPVEPAHPLRNNMDTGTTSQFGQERKRSKDLESGKLEKNEVTDKAEVVNEHPIDLDEAKRRKKEKKKERIAVARAIREARERAFFEAKERASMKACQTARSESENRPYEFSAEEEKIRAERAAVERATIEARQRALKKALSDKAGKHPTEKSSSSDPKCNNSSSQPRCSESLNNDEKFGADGTFEKRHKARSERQSQTFEQTDKSLEEKNKHDALAQQEQAARNMVTDALDAEFRRWSCGKEGNLRALLSTLHYILGLDSGWQAVSIIDLVDPTAMRKAYKKATLFVHPDKLQQRGATIQQKYICAKVFNLLKDAWSKFNPNEC